MLVVQCDTGYLYNNSCLDQRRLFCFFVKQDRLTIVIKKRRKFVLECNAAGGNNVEPRNVRNA